MCLEGQRPLTVVLSQIAANGLCARIGRPAVPHVLAARVHPCAPRAPVGLLLVSGAPRAGHGGKGPGLQTGACVHASQRPLPRVLDLSDKCCTGLRGKAE